MLHHYLIAFKQYKDYSSKATRKEYNMFILNFLMWSIFLNVCLSIAHSWLRISGILNLSTFDENNINHVKNSINFLFNTINYIPLLALTKRRVNDLTTKPQLIFLILLITTILISSWKIIMLFVLSILIKFSIVSNIDKIVAILLFICGCISAIGQLALMTIKSKCQ